MPLSAFLFAIYRLTKSRKFEKVVLRNPILPQVLDNTARELRPNALRNRKNETGYLGLQRVFLELKTYPI